MTVEITQNSANHTIYLESNNLRISIEPRNGGKIKSFFSKRSSKELFFQDGRKMFSDSRYSDHDISGYDECFPTVIQCDYPDGTRKGTDMGDHGWLWQKPWKSRIVGEKVVMSCDLPDLECSFERTCKFENETTLRLDYVIRNYGRITCKYLYSAHPMLFADERSQVVLPEEVHRVFVSGAQNIPGLEEMRWTDWPIAGAAILEDLSPDHHSVIKFYSEPLIVGKAGIFYKDSNEHLELEFDTDELPHLGVFYSQGYADSVDKYFKDVVFVGLEPTTGAGDDVPMCGKTKTVKTLPAGEEAEFWIKLRVK